MKKLILTALSVLMLGAIAYAASTSINSTATISVANVFAIEFYTDPKVLYSSAIPFTNVDPSLSMVYPDSRAPYDGKSDVGIVCKSNMGTTWRLKLEGAPSVGLLNSKFQYYMSQPYNRNTSLVADGTLSQTPAWYALPSGATVVYTAGITDKSNLPYGTLSTISYSLIPTGLAAGTTYTMAVKYTMTTEL